MPTATAKRANEIKRAKPSGADHILQWEQETMSEATEIDELETGIHPESDEESWGLHRPPSKRYKNLAAGREATRILHRQRMIQEDRVRSVATAVYNQPKGIIFACRSDGTRMMVMSLAQMLSLPVEITSRVGNILYYLNFDRSRRYIDTKGAQHCRLAYALELRDAGMDTNGLERSDEAWVSGAYSAIAVSGESLEHIVQFWRRAMLSEKDTIVVSPTMHRTSFAPLALVAAMMPGILNKPAQRNPMDNVTFMSVLTTKGQAIFDFKGSTTPILSRPESLVNTIKDILQDRKTGAYGQQVWQGWRWQHVPIPFGPTHRPAAAEPTAAPDWNFLPAWAIYVIGIEASIPIVIEKARHCHALKDSTRALSQAVYEKAQQTRALQAYKEQVSEAWHQYRTSVAQMRGAPSAAAPATTQQPVEDARKITERLLTSIVFWLKRVEDVPPSPDADLVLQKLDGATAYIAPTPYDTPKPLSQRETQILLAIYRDPTNGHIGSLKQCMNSEWCQQMKRAPQECRKFYWMCGDDEKIKHTMQPNITRKICQAAHQHDTYITGSNIWRTWRCPFCRVRSNGGYEGATPDKIVGKYKCQLLTAGLTCPHANKVLQGIERAWMNCKMYANMMFKPPAAENKPTLPITDPSVTTERANAIQTLVEHYRDAAAFNGMVTDVNFGLQAQVTYPVVSTIGDFAMATLDAPPEGWVRPGILTWDTRLTFSIKALQPGVTQSRLLIIVTRADPAEWIARYEEEFDEVRHLLDPQRLVSYYWKQSVKATLALNDADLCVVHLDAELLDWMPTWRNMILLIRLEETLRTYQQTLVVDGDYNKCLTPIRMANLFQNTAPSARHIPVFWSPSSRKRQFESYALGVNLEELRNVNRRATATLSKMQPTTDREGRPMITELSALIKQLQTSSAFEDCPDMAILQASDWNFCYAMQDGTEKAPWAHAEQLNSTFDAILPLVRWHATIGKMAWVKHQHTDRWRIDATSICALMPNESATKPYLAQTAMTAAQSISFHETWVFLGSAYLVTSGLLPWATTLYMDEISEHMWGHGLPLFLRVRRTPATVMLRILHKLFDPMLSQDDASPAPATCLLGCPILWHKIIYRRIATAAAHLIPHMRQASGQECLAFIHKFLKTRLLDTLDTMINLGEAVDPQIMCPTYPEPVKYGWFLPLKEGRLWGEIMLRLQNQQPISGIEGKTLMFHGTSMYAAAAILALHMVLMPSTGELGTTTAQGEKGTYAVRQEAPQECFFYAPWMAIPTAPAMYRVIFTHLVLPDKLTKLKGKRQWTYGHNEAQAVPAGMIIEAALPQDLPNGTPYTVFQPRLECNYHKDGKMNARHMLEHDNDNAIKDVWHHISQLDAAFHRHREPQPFLEVSIATAQMYYASVPPRAIRIPTTHPNSGVLAALAVAEVWSGTPLAHFAPDQANDIVEAVTKFVSDAVLKELDNSAYNIIPCEFGSQCMGMANCYSDIDRMLLITEASSDELDACVQFLQDHPIKLQGIIATEGMAAITHQIHDNGTSARTLTVKVVIKMPRGYQAFDFHLRNGSGGHGAHLLEAAAATGSNMSWTEHALPQMAWALRCISRLLIASGMARVSGLPDSVAQDGLYGAGLPKGSVWARLLIAVAYRARVLIEPEAAMAMTADQWFHTIVRDLITMNAETPLFLPDIPRRTMNEVAAPMTVEDGQAALNTALGEIISLQLLIPDKKGGLSGVEPATAEHKRMRQQVQQAQRVPGIHLWFESGTTWELLVVPILSSHVWTSMTSIWTRWQEQYRCPDRGTSLTDERSVQVLVQAVAACGHYEGSFWRPGQTIPNNADLIMDSASEAYAEASPTTYLKRARKYLEKWSILPPMACPLSGSQEKGAWREIVLWDRFRCQVREPDMRTEEHTCTVQFWGLQAGNIRHITPPMEGMPTISIAWNCGASQTYAVLAQPEDREVCHVQGAPPGRPFLCPVPRGGLYEVTLQAGNWAQADAAQDKRQEVEVVHAVPEFVPDIATNMLSLILVLTGQQEQQEAVPSRVGPAFEISAAHYGPPDKDLAWLTGQAILNLMDQLNCSACHTHAYSAGADATPHIIPMVVQGLREREQALVRPHGIGKIVLFMPSLSLRPLWHMMMQLQKIRTGNMLMQRRSHLPQIILVQATQDKCAPVLFIGRDAVRKLMEKLDPWFGIMEFDFDANDISIGREDVEGILGASLHMVYRLTYRNGPFMRACVQQPAISIDQIVEWTDSIRAMEADEPWNEGLGHRAEIHTTAAMIMNFVLAPLFIGLCDDVLFAIPWAWALKDTIPWVTVAWAAISKEVPRALSRFPFLAWNEPLNPVQIRCLCDAPSTSRSHHHIRHMVHLDASLCIYARCLCHGGHIWLQSLFDELDKWTGGKAALGTDFTAGANQGITGIAILLQASIFAIMTTVHYMASGKLAKVYHPEHTLPRLMNHLPDFQRRICSSPAEAWAALAVLIHFQLANTVFGVIWPKDGMQNITGYYPLPPNEWYLAWDEFAAPPTMSMLEKYHVTFSRKTSRRCMAMLRQVNPDQNSLDGSFSFSLAQEGVTGNDAEGMPRTNPIHMVRIPTYAKKSTSTDRDKPTINPATITLANMHNGLREGNYVHVCYVLVDTSEPGPQGVPRLNVSKTMQHITGIVTAARSAAPKEYKKTPYWENWTGKLQNPFVEFFNVQGIRSQEGSNDLEPLAKSYIIIKEIRCLGCEIDYQIWSHMAKLETPYRNLAIRLHTEAIPRPIAQSMGAMPRMAPSSKSKVQSIIDFLYTWYDAVNVIPYDVRRRPSEEHQNSCWYLTRRLMLEGGIEEWYADKILSEPLGRGAVDKIKDMLLRAITNPLPFLVLGPPGTGKSYNVYILAVAIISATKGKILFVMQQNSPLLKTITELIRKVGNIAVICPNKNPVSKGLYKEFLADRELRESFIDPRDNSPQKAEKVSKARIIGANLWFVNHRKADKVYDALQKKCGTVLTDEAAINAGPAYVGTLSALENQESLYGLQGDPYQLGAYINDALILGNDDILHAQAAAVMLAGIANLDPEEQLSVPMQDAVDIVESAHRLHEEGIAHAMDEWVEHSDTLQLAQEGRLIAIEAPPQINSIWETAPVVEPEELQLGRIREQEARDDGPPIGTIHSESFQSAHGVEAVRLLPLVDQGRASDSRVTADGGTEGTYLTDEYRCHEHVVALVRGMYFPGPGPRMQFTREQSEILLANMLPLCTPIRLTHRTSAEGAHQREEHEVLNGVAIIHVKGVNVQHWEAGTKLIDSTMEILYWMCMNKRYLFTEYGRPQKNSILLVVPHEATKNRLLQDKNQCTKWLKTYYDTDPADTEWDPAWDRAGDNNLWWIALAWMLAACDIANTEQVQGGAWNLVLFMVTAHNLFGLQDRKVNMVISRMRHRLLVLTDLDLWVRDEHKRPNLIALLALAYRCGMVYNYELWVALEARGAYKSSTRRAVEYMHSFFNEECTVKQPMIDQIQAMQLGREGDYGTGGGPAAVTAASRSWVANGKWFSRMISRVAKMPHQAHFNQTQSAIRHTVHVAIQQFFLERAAGRATKRRPFNLKKDTYVYATIRESWQVRYKRQPMVRHRCEIRHIGLVFYAQTPINHHVREGWTYAWYLFEEASMIADGAGRIYGKLVPEDEIRRTPSIKRRLETDYIMMHVLPRHYAIAELAAVVQADRVHKGTLRMAARFKLTFDRESAKADGTYIAPTPTEVNKATADRLKALTIPQAEFLPLYAYVRRFLGLDSIDEGMQWISTEALAAFLAHEWDYNGEWREEIAYDMCMCANPLDYDGTNIAVSNVEAFHVLHQTIAVITQDEELPPVLPPPPTLMQQLIQCFITMPIFEWLIPFLRAIHFPEETQKAMGLDTYDHAVARVLAYLCKSSHPYIAQEYYRLTRDATADCSGGRKKTMDLVRVTPEELHTQFQEYSFWTHVMDSELNRPEKEKRRRQNLVYSSTVEQVLAQTYHRSGAAGGHKRARREAGSSTDQAAVPEKMAMHVNRKMFNNGDTMDAELGFPMYSGKEPLQVFLPGGGMLGYMANATNKLVRESTERSQPGSEASTGNTDDEHPVVSNLPTPAHDRLDRQFQAIRDSPYANKVCRLHDDMDFDVFDIFPELRAPLQAALDWYEQGERQPNYNEEIFNTQGKFVAEKSVDQMRSHILAHGMQRLPFDYAQAQTDGQNENFRAWQNQPNKPQSEATPPHKSNGRYRMGRIDAWGRAATRIRVEVCDSMIGLARDDNMEFSTMLDQVHADKVRQGMLELQEAVLDYAQYVSDRKGGIRQGTADGKQNHTCPMPGIHREDIDAHTQEIVVRHANARYKVQRDTWLPKQLTPAEDQRVLQLSKVQPGYVYLAKLLEFERCTLHIGLSTVAYFTPRVANKVRGQMIKRNLMIPGVEIGGVIVVEVIPLSRMIVVEPVSFHRLVALQHASRLSFSRLTPYIENIMQIDG